MKITAGLLLIIVLVGLVVVWAWTERRTSEGSAEGYIREELHQLTREAEDLSHKRPKIKVVARELQNLKNSKSSGLASELRRVSDAIGRGVDNILDDLDKGDHGRIEKLCLQLHHLADKLESSS